MTEARLAGTQRSRQTGKETERKRQTDRQRERRRQPSDRQTGSETG